jgi:hypothetical protein
VNRSIERVVALLAILVIPLLLAAVPLTTVLAVCDHWPRVGAGRATPQGLADRVRRWLGHGRGPWTSSCLTRSLVLYALLRQHGYRPRLSLGVAGASADFTAHAWVSLGDAAIEEPSDVVQSYQPLMVHGG